MGVNGVKAVKAVKAVEGRKNIIKKASQCDSPFDDSRI